MVFNVNLGNPLKCMLWRKTEPRVWFKLSWIDQKLVQFCPNPLKYVTICRSNFGLLSDNPNPHFVQNRKFTKTPNFGRYRNHRSITKMFHEPGFCPISRIVTGVPLLLTCNIFSSFAKHSTRHVSR